LLNWHPAIIPLRRVECSAAREIGSVLTWKLSVCGETQIVEILKNDSLPFAGFGKLEIKQIEDDVDFLDER
jgi:hypothetical protein